MIWLFDIIQWLFYWLRLHISYMYCMTRVRSYMNNQWIAIQWLEQAVFAKFTNCTYLRSVIILLAWSWAPFKYYTSISVIIPIIIWVAGTVSGCWFRPLRILSGFLFLRLFTRLDYSFMLFSFRFYDDEWFLCIVQ